jgi:hypothetical protein
MPRPFQFFNAGSLGNMCPYSELTQPGTQQHRSMQKEHLYKILECPCNQRKQFKRQ